ncbi:MAG: hypothetical protein COB35_02580 [Gammaproteobacteria bacterium]|nr:MAG: hypothetical protein COB35_02580 [Gammaproteobacteria bacterium]
MTYLRILFTVLCCTLAINAVAENENSVALFNLKPISMDAIGADADLLYALETELDKSDKISVMSRRDVEAALYRIGGAQVSETNLVVAYEQEMGANFIITGEIDKIGSSIQVTIKLVDIIAKDLAQIWSETYKGRGDVLQRSKGLAKSIEEAIILASSTNYTSSDNNTDTNTNEYIQDISAVAKNNGVSLSWTIDPAVSAFYTNIYRGKTEGGLFEFVASIEENQYQDDVQGQFFYRLDLVLDNGSEIKGLTLVQVKSIGKVVDTDLLPPTILTSKNLLHGIKIELVPQLNNKGVVGYNFYQKVNDEQWKKVHSIRKNNQLNYSVILDKNFIANSAYQLYVTAYSRIGESERSDILTVRTQPSLVLTSNDQALLRQAQLKWQGNDHAKGYNVYRKEAADSTWQLISKITTKKTTSFNDTKALKDATEYNYAVSAFDKYTETPKSVAITVTTKGLPQVPQGLEIQTGSVKQVKLTWQPIEDNDISGYVIYRKVGEFKSGDLLDEVAFIKGYQQNSYIDGTKEKPLKDGTRYFYAIAAKNVFGARGSLTPAINATTKALPTQPEQLNLNVISDAITINWQNNSESDITHYTLYRKWNNGAWLKVANVDGNSYQDDDLKAYAKTFYRLSVTDKDNLVSTFSEVQQINSPLTLQLSIAQENMLRAITISWNKVNHIKGYKIYRKHERQTNWRLIKTITSTQQNRFKDFDKKGMREGKIYQYKITVFDNVMETISSNLVAGKTKKLPEPPLDFKGKNNQVKKITLSWRKSTDNDDSGYIIYRKNNSGTFKEIKKISNRSTTHYKDDGELFSSLTDGTAYSYKIATYNRFSAVGATSEIIEVSTKALPEKISGLSIEEDVSGLMLFWQPLSDTDINIYQIYRSVNSSCSGLRKIATVASTSDVYMDTKVKEGKSYCYRVTAIDNDKLEGRLSPSVSFTIPAIAEDN